ncbi:MAG: hypothetical protein MK060_19430 [Blastomonas sp.]|nr:hypothetical protein [Blastomonas sp.]
MAAMTPSFTAVYNSYRAAKAQFDLELFTLAQEGRDMDRDMEDILSNAHSEAMMALFMHPAANVHELYRKLEVYNLEGVYDAFRDARIISAALENDAGRLMHQP